ncbi:MAG: hypothetical protein D6741_21735, partial [Planctomycetota bacterium]
KIASRYADLFREAQLEDQIVLPEHVSPGRHVWNQYVIRVLGGRRDALRSFLQQRKIGSEIYYPLGLHEQECFAHLGYAPTDLPETFAASREVMALPIFPGLTIDEQSAVVDAIADFFAQSPKAKPAKPMFLKRTESRTSRTSARDDDAAAV